MIALEWRSIVSSNNRDFWIKGTELDMALVPGSRSRLALYSVRAYDADRNADVRYRVRDAGKISDADVKAGKRPPIVAEYATLDEFEAALSRARVDHPGEFEDDQHHD